MCLFLCFSVRSSSVSAQSLGRVKFFPHSWSGAELCGELTWLRCCEPLCENWMSEILSTRADTLWTMNTRASLTAGKQSQVSVWVGESLNESHDRRHLAAETELAVAPFFRFLSHCAPLAEPLHNEMLQQLMLKNEDYIFCYEVFSLVCVSPCKNKTAHSCFSLFNLSIRLQSSRVARVRLAVWTPKKPAWQRSCCPVSWKAERQKIDGDTQINAVSEECLCGSKCF